MFFFLITFSVYSTAQVFETIDSLKKELAEENNPEKRAQILYDIGDNYFSTQRDSSILYLSQAYQLSKQFDNTEFKSKTAALLGMAYQVVDMEKASEYLFEGLRLAEEDGDLFLMSYNYNLISTHYRLTGDLDLAGEYCQKSVDLKFEIKDSIGIAFCYNNLGIIHMMKADYDIGLEYWMLSLEMKLALGDSIGAANTMSNIGIYYKDIGRTGEALNYFQSGLDMELELDKLDRASHSYQYLGDLHMSINRYRDAIESYDMSIELMDSIGMHFDKLEPLLGLSKAYEGSGNYQKAYHTLEKYRKLNAVYQDSSKSKVSQELAAKYETEKKEKENALLKSENVAKDAQIKEEEAKTALKEANNRYLWIGLSLVLIILILIVISLSRVRKAKLEVELQKDIVEEKNREITDSITYAQRLQEAILPTAPVVNNALKNNFILYLPKDIVAGDFYWLETKGDKVLFAVADCTGHGVPGAFVSVVCHNALNRAVREFNLEDPAKILDKVTELVIETFEKSEQDVKDGMDISLCVLNKTDKTIHYAGANNSLYYVRNGELNEIKANKQPVGKYDALKPFNSHIITLEDSDTFYLFTDGYADQFGGERGKKFKYKSFKNLLVEMHQQAMNAQKSTLETTFRNWMGDHEQIDDVCVMGVKV